MKFPLLFIALDGLAEDRKKTLKVVREISSLEGNFGFKINLDAFVTGGLWNPISEVRNFARRERPIFADLKMWNGARTMLSIVEMLIEEDVDFFNVYALADSELQKVTSIATSDSATRALGLTVLSHYDDDYCQKHFRRSLPETVRHFAEVALERGCDGIILPGTALDIVQDLETIKVVSGVRPEWFKDDRHQQEISPREAIEKGADILVCGSPIFKSPNPTEALQKILAEIATANT